MLLIKILISKIQKLIKKHQDLLKKKEIIFENYWIVDIRILLDTFILMKLVVIPFGHLDPNNQESETPDGD